MIGIMHSYWTEISIQEKMAFSAESENLTGNLRTPHRGNHWPSMQISQVFAVLVFAHSYGDWLCVDRSYVNIGVLVIGIHNQITLNM